MKTRIALLLGAGAIVLVLLAMTWPVSRSSIAGPRLDTLTGAEELVDDLEEIQAASKRQETEVERLRMKMTRLAAADSSGVLQVLGPVTSAGTKRPVGKKPPPPKPKRHPPQPRRSVTQWPELRLDGIVAGGDQSMAIINGDTYHVNDEIDGIIITEIDADAVLLTSPVGASRRLKLGGWNEEMER